MSEPKTDWGKDLVKAMETMRDEFNSHKDETIALTKELSIFRSQVETVFQIVPPKEMASRVNSLVTDLASFQSKVETLISVTRWAAGIIIGFLLGTILTVIGGAITLVSAVNSQKVETAHLAKQVERLESSLTQRSPVSANSINQTVKELHAEFENLSDKLIDNERKNAKTSVDPVFPFVLTKKSYVRRENGSPGGIYFFKMMLPNQAKVERYHRILAEFPGCPTRTIISSMSEGLERIVGFPADPHAPQAVLGPRVIRIKVRPEGKDSFEISLEGTEQNSSTMIERLVSALNADENEYIMVSFKFLTDM